MLRRSNNAADDASGDARAAKGHKSFLAGSSPRVKLPKLRRQLRGGPGQAGGMGCCFRRPGGHASFKYAQALPRDSMDEVGMRDSMDGDADVSISPVGTLGPIQDAHKHTFWKKYIVPKEGQFGKRVKRSRGSYPAERLELDEAWAYGTALASKELSGIAHAFPRYFGTIDIEDHTYVCMEDLTFGMRGANVLELRMGTRSYGSDATDSKIARTDAKPGAELQRSKGFRPLKMGIWDGEQNVCVKRNKDWGRALTETTCTSSLELFFQTPDGPRLGVLDEVIKQLTCIHEWFQMNHSYRFYGSSLLLVFEGASGPRDRVESSRPTVRMVNLGHVYANEPGDESRDEGYLTGAGSLLNMLADLKKRLWVEWAKSSAKQRSTML